MGNPPTPSATARHAYGDEYESKWYDNTKELVGDYIDHHPTPTCLRNHAFLKEVAAGRGPIHMVTKEAFQDTHKETVGWENFLGMTISQAVVWASQDIDPRYTNPELTTSEPYVMGSHATCSGAWASGPEDVSPSEYFWGYNRMMTVDGLFAAGDAAGGTAHAFSSGSFTLKEDFVRKRLFNTSMMVKLMVLKLQKLNVKNLKRKYISL